MSYSYDVYAVASKCTEEFSRDARDTLHPVAHDSHCSEVLLALHFIYLSHSQLMSELLAYYLDCLVGLCILDSERNRILRSRLRYEEHRNAVVSQRAVQSLAHASHADHTHAQHRDERSIVDRRNTLDAVGAIVLAPGNECAWSRRIESILYEYRNILVINRENRRRINNLSTEIAKLHRLDKTQSVNNISLAYNARVGCHESIDIGPNLQLLRAKSRRYDGSRIVRAATTEVCYSARIGIGRYESAAKHNPVLLCVNVLLDKFVCQRHVWHILVPVRMRLYQFQRVNMLGTHNCRHDNRRHPLAERHNSVEHLHGNLSSLLYLLVFSRELIQQSAYLRPHIISAARQHTAHHALVSFSYLRQSFFISASDSVVRCLDKQIRYASESRDHNNQLTLLAGNDVSNAIYAFHGTYGRTAEFHHFHTLILLAFLMFMPWHKISSKLAFYNLRQQVFAFFMSNNSRFAPNTEFTTAQADK